MKKNISINISGIIFHIEEDGYENLRKYLDSINKYFASYEDSSEILADIESRVAEIFLSKLNEGKQVITADDVQSLIATMGSVSDFKAAEDQEFTSEKTKEKKQERASAAEEEGPSRQETRRSPRQQQLFRDQKRKILGGVCSGIANYFSVDAIWIRLLFALLAFAYGITIIAYIVMWIVVPGTFDLEEPDAIKKMFRDGERKVIAGVSGGVSAFFGIDILAVRILFIVLTVFFGVGFVIYIVLWIALPEARSLTDRMEMQGEPVTLSNIESNIKRNLNVDPDKEETTLTKILLFPFRLIGLLLNALGKILGPLIEVLRVVIGIIVVMLGACLMLTVIITAGIFIGLFSASAFAWPNELSMPLDVFTNSISGWTVLAAFLAAIVPSILITLLGASIIAKRYVFNPAVGWTLFVFFFVSVAMLSVTIPRMVYSFKEEGEYKTETLYDLTGSRALIKINEVGMDDYHAVSLNLKGYEGKQFRLVQTFKAQGVTKQKAIENAQMVDYHVTASDSVLTFDSNIQFKENAIFRAQRMDMTLYIPYNRPFVMDESASRFISQYVDYGNMDNNTWEITADKGLTCTSCPVSEEDKNKIVDDELRDFDEVDLRGVFDVRILRGDDFTVEMIGSESEKNKYKIFRSGETLVIEYGRPASKKKFDWNVDVMDMNEMRINITMPQLEKIEAEGVGKIEFDRFDGHDLDIRLRGPVKLKGELNMQELVINLTGKSEAELSGHSSSLFAELQFASRLRAYNLEVQDALVEANGASSAKVNVRGNLEMEEGLASEIDYRGSPNVTKRD